MKIYIFFFIYLLTNCAYSQELKTKVLVNTEQLQSSESYIFEELRNNIEQFLNNQIWTNDKYLNEEKINCNFIINILNEPSTGLYEATVQIVSSRPIYNTSYESIILNHGDREWIFEYVPSQNIEYIENGLNDNLSSLLSFYAYIIIGMDNDSFENLGGNKNFEKAWKILNNSQESGYKGWDQFGSKQNRYWLCENFINPEFKIVRESIYNYHINGMDNFYSDSNKSRLIILKSLEEINKINKNKFNSTIINIFLNAKSDELTNVFLNGSLDTKRNAYNILTELSPSRSDLFNKILE